MNNSVSSYSEGLCPIHNAEDDPYDYPWWKEKESDDEVQQVIHLLPPLTDHGSPLYRLLLLHYHNIRRLLLLCCWRWIVATLGISLLRRGIPLLWIVLLRIRLLRIPLLWIPLWISLLWISLLRRIAWIVGRRC